MARQFLWQIVDGTMPEIDNTILQAHVQQSAFLFVYHVVLEYLMHSVMYSTYTNPFNLYCKLRLECTEHLSAYNGFSSLWRVRYGYYVYLQRYIDTVRIKMKILESLSSYNKFYTFTHIFIATALI